MAIYTIGHSKLTVEQIRQKMDELQIDFLVDIRSIPYSRFSRAFNKRALIAAFGSSYLWKGTHLGGKPGPASQNGIDWLISEHEKGRRLLLVCLERDPRACHRLTDIGVRLLSGHNIDAIHLIHDGTQRTTKEYGFPWPDQGA